MRSRPLLVLVLAAATLTAGAAPAGAVASFGPIVTVMPVPAGCAADHVDGDAEISPFNGVIRGFATFSGTGCDEDAIWFFGGSGGSWTFQQTPYQGRVLAAGEHSASYVLFSSSAGLWSLSGWSVTWVRGRSGVPYVLAWNSSVWANSPPAPTCSLHTAHQVWSGPARTSPCGRTAPGIADESCLAGVR